MFFLVVLFGLYNGLFVLPVVLSLIGPLAYASSSEPGRDNPADPEGEPLKPIIKSDADPKVQIM